MKPALTPATDWKERIAPDEAKRFAGYARHFAAIQARKSKKYGTGRALHRKQITAARGSLQVLDDLPPRTWNMPRISAVASSGGASAAAGRAVAAAAPRAAASGSRT